MKSGTTDTARLVFLSYTDQKWMQARPLGSLKHRYGTGACRDHLAAGKADPLALVLTEQLISAGPVILFVLAPVRMELPGDFWR